MKVILLKDVKKIGKRYEIKEVSDGYARNFLIPGNMVKIANEENMEWLEREKEREEKMAEEALKKTGEKAFKLDGREIEIPVRVGNEGQLFEKIDEKDISKKMKELGYEVEKSQIKIEEPISDLGEFPVKIKFDHNLEAEIKVIVIEEIKEDAVEEDE